MERLIDRLYYVASPYTHKDPKIMKQRADIIDRIGAKLVKKQIGAMFLPITQSVRIAKVGKIKGRWCDWRKQDLPLVRRADGLIVIKLDGWNKSIGVNAEIREARKLKKKIYYLRPEDVDQFNPQ